MTQEEKNLLLKDLCARLPYGVKVQIQNEAGYDVTFQLSGYSMGYFYINGDAFEEDELKPYLRPMDSMTEEEKEDRYHIITTVYDGEVIDDEFVNVVQYMDWLNSHHFDYRGLIEKGLALEAPKEMYKLNN